MTVYGGRSTLLTDNINNLGHPVKLLRTNVGAVGESKVDQHKFVVQAATVKGLPMMICQLERAAQPGRPRSPGNLQFPCIN